MMPAVQIDIFAPLPNLGQQRTLAIEPEVTSLSWTTAIGGFQGLSVGLRNPQAPGFGFLPEPVDLGDLDHVVVTMGGHTCFEGRVVRIQGKGANITGFGAVGYGFHATKDAPYFSADVSTYPAGEIVRSAILQSARLLQLDDAGFGDTGIEHPAHEFDGMFPAQIITQLSGEGGGSGAAAVPFDFFVWENRRAFWQARTVPQQARYAIDFDDAVEWDRDATDLYNTVFVRYTPPGGVENTIDASSADLVAKARVSRSTLVQGQTMTDNGADEFMHTTLNGLAEPAIAATVSYQDGAGPTLPGGAAVDYWIPRAGEWVAVGDQPFNIIIQTTHDAMRRSVSLQLQHYPRELFRGFLDLQRAAAQVAARLSPVSGAKVVA